MDWQVRLAYIDPVSGSILIQTLIAAAAGGVAFFRKSIWALFKRPAPPSPTAHPPAATPIEKDRKVS